MKLRSTLAAVVLAIGALTLPALAPAVARAQEAPAAPAAEPHRPGPADLILPHITDSKTIEFPCIRTWTEWACEYTFAVHNVTVAGHTFDIGWTKHIFFLAFSGFWVVVLLLVVASKHKAHSSMIGRPKGFAAGIEAIILYLRDVVYLPVLGGKGGEKFVPFCLTLVFFIAACNIFGLMPWGSTATGNVGVTATLAAITFVVIEVAGMRALGKGYLGTIIYWPHDQPLSVKALTVIMTPVEIIGKFTKPFALTIRLFANMISGHVIILALIGLIFMFGIKSTIVAPVGLALFIMFLEILVSFIQAFIFSLLAAVFIGQIRSAHH